MIFYVRYLNQYSQKLIFIRNSNDKNTKIKYNFNEVQLVLHVYVAGKETKMYSAKSCLALDTF